MARVVSRRWIRAGAHKTFDGGEVPVEGGPVEGRVAGLVGEIGIKGGGTQ